MTGAQAEYSVLGLGQQAPATPVVCLSTQQVALAFVISASSDSDVVTGQILAADGRRTASVDTWRVSRMLMSRRLAYEVYVMRNGSLIEMYERGRGLEESVWRMLMMQGELDEGSALWDEAYAVAQATMRRVKQNIETMIGYLNDHDYRFDPMDKSGDLAPWSPPPSDTEVNIQRIADIAGSLPLSLRAWWEIVGSVDLHGAFDDAARAVEDGSWRYADALFVTPVADAVKLLIAEQAAHEKVSSSARVAIAPDVYAKGKISGGPPYEIRLPDKRADAPFLNVVIFLPLPPGGKVSRQRLGTSETFVDYLRRSFRWGGFPGCAFVDCQEEERLLPLIAQLRPI
jgi:hypothetical protein